MAKLNRADLDGVIRRYAPLICLHPREKYFPCSVEWFLERAELRRKSGGDGVPVSVSTLPTQNVGEGEYWLEYPNTDEAKSGKMDTARAYVHARLGYDESYTDLQYWYFYAYNGPGTSKVGSLVADTVVKSGDVNMAPLGEHFGDWEHVTIRIDNSSKNMIGYYLSQHSDGEWVTGDELNNADKNTQDADVRLGNPVGRDQLIVYPSLNGHGFYRWKNARNYSEHRKYTAAHTGVEFRLCNDTDDRGPKFDTAKSWQLVAVSPPPYADFLGSGKPTEPRWLSYPYRWGPEGTQTTLQPNHVREILQAAFGVLGLAVSATVGRLATELAFLYKKDDLNGPSGPKEKTGAWSGTEIMGQEETQTTPFVAEGYIYFQGTNNGLYRVRDDGSGTQRIGRTNGSAGNETRAQPIVYKGYVYFRGSNNGLYRVRGDGSGFQQIGGGLETIAAPFLYNDWIYFQGTNSGLYRVRIDGSQFQQIRDYETKSSPFVSDEWVYFQGRDNGLYRVRTDGNGFHRIGGNESLATPFPSSGWVYFRGTNNGLYRVRVDGSGPLQRIGENFQGNGFEGHSTLSAPVVQGDWVYFQGTNNGLFRTRTDGSVWHQIGGHETTAAPFVVNEKVYFRGTNKKLLMVSTGDRQEAAAGAGR